MPGTTGHDVRRRPLTGDALRDEGVQGFDEYMNVVLDNAEEIHMKKKTRKPIGTLLPSPSEPSQEE